jgi:hypothetical protein
MPREPIESTVQEIARGMAAMVVPGANLMYANITVNGGDDFIQLINLPVRSECGKFDKGTAIWIDLPCRAMNQEQSERARKAFGELGVECPTEEHCVDVNGKPFMIVTWKLNVGTDPEFAARTALRLLDEVFQLPKGASVLFWCEDAD